VQAATYYLQAIYRQQRKLPGEERYSIKARLLPISESQAVIFSIYIRENGRSDLIFQGQQCAEIAQFL
jgi:hypothetical protein